MMRLSLQMILRMYRAFCGKIPEWRKTERQYIAFPVLYAVETVEPI